MTNRLSGPSVGAARVRASWTLESELFPSRMTNEAAMSLSIRNQFRGTITDVTVGEAMATVKVCLAGGQDLTAAITADAVEDLGLAAGGAVTALVKSTDVALATSAVSG